MKVIEIVAGAYLVSLVSTSLYGDESHAANVFLKYANFDQIDLETSQDNERVFNVTSLFDIALDTYRSIIVNHYDRQVHLADMSVRIHTDLSATTTSVVQVFNGTMRDLYSLRRVGPVTIQSHQIRAASLTAFTDFELTEFYVTYRKFRMFTPDDRLTKFFVIQPRKNSIRIVWNIVMASIPFIDVKSVILREAADCLYKVGVSQRTWSLRREIGSNVFEHMLPELKGKIETTIKKYFVLAIENSKIVGFLKYLKI